MVGILLVVILLRLTMRTDPKGCILFLAALIFLVFWFISLALLTL
jgi:hypothetical protein